ncbi:uncharacterized protein LOC119557141 [Drosophila subpulchrella]|uniref:uncharacterized protein LOC119557141 n=1 Tax=Drosophila subpulchrella TaxID=1486046 RepID=UPI0018A16374|nr:uncharacterized protein LOC119557141 [Drosophila subpulchrella]
MWPIYTVCLGLLLILPQDVIGTCKMEAGPNFPLVITQFGSKLLESDSIGTYEREDGETIDLYCGSGFSYQRSGYGEASSTKVKATMHCHSNGYFYDQRTDNPMSNVRCLKGALQMFESETSMQNCEGDMTLVLGHEFDGKGSIKSAALCYDILSSRMKYIGYTTFPTKNRIITKTQVGQLNDIGLDINVTYQKYLIKTVSQGEIDAYLAKERQLTQLFAGGTFQIGSLVQDEAVARQLRGYEDMMSTIWMRALRAGNWKHWIQAMRDASDAIHFDVRLGVSGDLELPMAIGRPCNASRSLKIELADGSSIPIPAHIWAHVHALEKTGGVQDEFVLIGHNSPFLSSDNSSDFCPSMCDQVSWLRSSLFGSLREFPAYGLVQCCRVEDVASKLDNFPGSFASVNASRNTAEVQLLDLLTRAIDTTTVPNPDYPSLT